MSPRKHYTIGQKVSMVETFNRRQQENDNISLRAYATEVGIDPAQFCRWRRQHGQMIAFLTNRGANNAARSLHRGRASCLDKMEEELLQFVFQNREQGMSVSIRMVTTKACQLDAEFRRKSTRARDHSIRRFVASHGIVHRVHTHQSQRNMDEVHGVAQDWMNVMCPMMDGSNRHQDFILNMDQTPIFFSMLPKTTLNESGARTINVRTSNGNTIRVTTAVTISASGRMLKPMMVFKGKAGGRIEREFGDYVEGGVYSVQEKAWMDERIILDWVQQVLAPYVATAPPGVHPLLLLDSYRCHMMASVVNVINDLGVQVEHIPSGCTGLCQPIDVGIGKPLKNRVRNLWEDWMIDQGGQTLRFAPPSRKMVADWVVTSLLAMPEEMNKRSWRHHPFSYFPNENEDDNQNDIPNDHNSDDDNDYNYDDDDDNDDNTQQQSNNNNTGSLVYDVVMV